MHGNIQNIQTIIWPYQMYIKSVVMFSLLIFAVILLLNCLVLILHLYMHYLSLRHYYLPPADRPGTGDYKMLSVRACVRVLVYTFKLRT